jgi:hypothetical protein
MNNSVKQSHFREAETSSATQEILHVSRKPKVYHGFYKCCQQFLSRVVSFQIICRSPRLIVLLHDVLCIQGEELLASRLTSKI